MVYRTDLRFRRPSPDGEGGFCAANSRAKDGRGEKPSQIALLKVFLVGASIARPHKKYKPFSGEQCSPLLYFFCKHKILNKTITKPFALLAVICSAVSKGLYFFRFNDSVFNCAAKGNIGMVDVVHIKIKNGILV